MGKNIRHQQALDLNVFQRVSWEKRGININTTVKIEDDTFFRLLIIFRRECPSRTYINYALSQKFLNQLTLH